LVFAEKKSLSYYFSSIMHEYKIPSPKNLSMTAERKKLSRRFGQHAKTKILAGPCRPSRITQPAELKFEQNASLIFLGFSVPPSRSHFHLHHEPLLL